MGGDHAGHELALQRDGLLDPDLAGLEATGQHGLVDRRGAGLVVRERLLGAAGLDHHHGHIAVVELTPGNDEFERALLGLVVRRVRDPLAGLAERDAHRADGTVERDARDHERSRRGVDRQHVVGLLVIGTDHVGDDLRLVAEALGERRAQRAVGETTREDGILARAALTTEERAGDLADRVLPFLDVDRQREEVHAGPHGAGGVGGGEHGRATDRRDDSTLGLRCELAGLERERLVGARNGARHADGISHENGSFPTRDHFPVDLERSGRFPVGNPA
jgi:hypothetical protein